MQVLDMPVVSVRLDPKDLAYLRKHKLKPGPFVKEVAEREIQHLRLKETLAYLSKNRMPAKPGDRPAVDLIREDRDHGH